jgi:prolyl-tRNA synthetase
VKLNDADLLGFPVRLVVSPRNVRAGAVEIKRRTEDEAALVEAGQVLAKVRELLEDARSTLGS